MSQIPTPIQEYMSFLPLSALNSNSTLSAGFTISATIMDYLGEEPPSYFFIRQAVSRVFLDEAENPYPSSEPSYIVLYQSPMASDPREAEIIGLANEHFDQAFHKKNSLLIDEMIRPISIYLAEGFDKLKPPTKQVSDLFLTKRMISPKSQENLTLLGWDNNVNIQEVLECYLDKKVKKIKKYDGNGELQLVFFASVIQKEINELPDPYLGIRTASLKVEAMKMLDKLMADRFSTATPSKIQSLKALNGSQTEKSRIFLDAGVQHFQPRFLDDPRYSLKNLYNLFKNRSVIVLCPSHILQSKLTQKVHPQAVEFQKRLDLLKVDWRTPSRLSLTAIIEQTQDECEVDNSLPVWM